ncbi:MAG: uncharacterized protein JWM21_2228 [Acidobacteria bacterium]|nr:uncharacterized protein [Acidobacteriota bacterium]
MAWKSLRNSLTTKPRVLAGPILRKVTPQSVTVWFALRVGANVKLVVLDDHDAKVMEGSRATVAVGSNLHLVAVTAIAAAPSHLSENVIYSYEVTFDFTDQVSMGLDQATANAPLAYPPFARPSFCLPSSNLNTLRLLQGSCRIPHGNGKDALDLADFLLAQSAGDPARRPQQLLLTGDQIYADDVAPEILLMLTDAAEVLLAWKEMLPVSAQHGGPQTADQLPPFLRRPILDDAGFTSEDLDSHLMSFGEYLSMYLFVWSDVLWPGEPDLPGFADVEAACRANIVGDKAFRKWLIARAYGHDRQRFPKEAAKILLFREPLQRVRRVLANVPSYMIFDDHEVTDDWNMTRDFCKGIYGNALGLRVVQNALVAYTLCQHWGNAPEQFDLLGQAAAPLPGRTLLTLVDGTNAGRYELDSSTLRDTVGVHDDTVLQGRPERGLFHAPNTLLFNFTVEGPAHQVIFTDTRTWRSFPKHDDEGGVLLSSDQLLQQIVQTPPTGERALLVVLTTNSPPVQPIRTATRYDFISNTFEHFPDVYEAWELPSLPFDRLMVALSNKLPLVGGQRTGPLILLSGDVHHSFASRMLYKAKARFEDAQPQPVKSVVAQLVASSFRKQTDSTLGFQREGYAYGPNWLARLLIPSHTREGYAGWNTPAGAERAVGQRGHEIAGAWVPLLTLTLDQATLQVSPDGFFLGVAINPAEAPDYSYTLDYLLPTLDTIPTEQPAPIPALGSGATLQDRMKAAAAFRTATRQFRKYNAGNAKVSKVIGVNNLGEITFNWDANDPRKRKVSHTLHWRIDQTDTVQVTDYVVSLDPDDAGFAEIQPRAMP